MDFSPWESAFRGAVQPDLGTVPLSASSEFGPVWEGWGIAAWALILGGLAVAAALFIVFFVRRPRWVEQLEEREAASQVRSANWLDRATKELGEKKMRRLTITATIGMLFGFILAVAGGIEEGRPKSPRSLVVMALLFALAATIYVCLQRIDAAAFRRDRPRGVTVSWIAAAVALVGLFVWELLDPTPDETFQEGLFRTFLLGGPAVVFFVARRSVRSHLGKRELTD